MEDKDQLYLNFVKQDINQLKFIGDPEEQIKKIRCIIKRLCLIPDEQLQKNIKLFYDEQIRINGERDQLQEKILKLMNDDNENLKNMYEQVLLKL